MKNLLQIDSLKDNVRMNTLINEYFLSRMNANGQYRVCLLAKIKSNVKKHSQMFTDVVFQLH